MSDSVNGCHECELEIRKKQQQVTCVQCSKRYHRICLPDFTQEKFRQLKKAQELDSWLCGECEVKKSGVEKETLKEKAIEKKAIDEKAGEKKAVESKAIKEKAVEKVIEAKIVEEVFEEKFIEETVVNEEKKTYHCCTEHGAPIKPSVGNEAALTFVDLPFYETVHEVMKPTAAKDIYCPNQYASTYTTSKRCRICLQLTEESMEKLTNKPQSGSESYRLFMRICKHGTGKQKDDYSSMSGLVFNAHFISLKTHHINLCGKASPVDYGPVDVTDEFLKKKLTYGKVVNLVFFIDTDKCYVSMYIMRKRSVSDVVDVLTNSRLDHPQHTQLMIQKKLTGGSDDICVTDMKVSLTCPIGKKRLEVPCRGRLCNHLQCVDATTFISMNEKRNTWKCPVCEQMTDFEDLRIDGLFQNILDKVSANVDVVKFKENGAWSHDFDEGNKENAPICLDDTINMSIDEGKVTIDLTETDDEGTPCKKPGQSTTANTRQPLADATNLLNTINTQISTLSVNKQKSSVETSQATTSQHSKSGNQSNSSHQSNYARQLCITQTSNTSQSSSSSQPNSSQSNSSQQSNNTSGSWATSRWGNITSSSEESNSTSQSTSTSRWEPSYQSSSSRQARNNSGSGSTQQTWRPSSQLSPYRSAIRPRNNGYRDKNHSHQKNKPYQRHGGGHNTHRGNSGNSGWNSNSNWGNTGGWYSNSYRYNGTSYYNQPWQSWRDYGTSNYNSNQSSHNKDQYYSSDYTGYNNLSDNVFSNMGSIAIARIQL